MIKQRAKCGFCLLSCLLNELIKDETSLQGTKHLRNKFTGNQESKKQVYKFTKNLRKNELLNPGKIKMYEIIYKKNSQIYLRILTSARQFASNKTLEP